MQLARRFLGFVKATVIGGVFVLAPIVALVFLIGKALAVAYDAIRPLLKWLPADSVGGVSLTLLAAIGALVAICFVAGLVANTAIAKWIVHSIETAILTNLPGYSLVKSMGEGIVGVNNPAGRKAVVVRFDDQSQIGFLMDELADGRLVVFVPNVPSPWSGSLHLLSHDRVEKLDVPIQQVVDRMQRLGFGLGKTLSGKVVEASRPDSP